MIWQIPRMWDEGDVWIIGGGPSIPREFDIPDTIIKAVVSRRASPNIYTPYLAAIYDKHVIGINVAYLLGDWIDLVFFGDKGFFLAHQEGLSKFNGLRVSCHPTANDIDWVKFLPRDKEHRFGISSNSRMVSWNGNSGAAAISIAAHAGARRIILLGFDMKLNETKDQHWHDVYGRGKARDEKKIMKMPFHRHLRAFPEIAKDAKRMGIEILNASPDSKIECFRKVSVKELL